MEHRQLRQRGWILALIFAALIAVIVFGVLVVGPRHHAATIVPAADEPMGVPAASSETTLSPEEPELVVLGERCQAGELTSCDELYHRSDAGTKLEQLAASCAGRRPGAHGGCAMTAEPGEALPHNFGDDKALDGLWTKCADGHLAACDDLFWSSPTMSNYEYFAEYCGERDEAPAVRGRCAAVDP